jgi:UDP-2,3-diacylglucosamine pyrophosphatase LpxH
MVWPVLSRFKMFRIAHISDFHLRGVDADFDRAVALIAQAQSEADHVVIAGDIVDCAERKVLRAFRTSLEELGLTRATDVTVVPGNHDIFPFTKKPPFARLARPTKNWEFFCDTFASTRRGRGSRRLVRGEPFPVGKTPAENVVLAAIDSTRNNCYDPRMSASGELPDHHVEAVAEFFAAHAKARHKVVVMHHCPWKKLEESENKRFPMGMAEPDAETSINWLQWAGATLVLCGHYHVNAEKKDLGGGLTGFCAGTAGGADDSDDNRLFHIIELGENGRIRVRERVFDHG